MFETARWKRKEARDYKFDDVTIEEFTDHSCLTTIRYPFVYLQALKSIMIYMADLAIMSLLFYSQIRKELDTACGVDFLTGQEMCATGTPVVRWSQNLMPYEYRPYIQLGSIMLSFFFLVLDWRKALKVIQSRGIAVAFTSNIANRFYSLRSYPHFCFFLEIRNSRKAVEVVAFWVFFTLKGWKRLLLAEMPRQAINFLTVVDVIDQQRRQSQFSGKVPDVRLMIQAFAMYFTNDKNDIRFKLTYGLQVFTISLWTISFLLLIAAMLVWIPLIFRIRGNLKEYICHIVDKRLDGLLKQRAIDGSEQGTIHGSEYKGSTLHREKTAASSASGAQPHWPGSEMKLQAPPTPYMQHQYAGHHYNQQQMHHGQWGHYDHQKLAPPPHQMGGPPSPTVSSGSGTLPPYGVGPGEDFPSPSVTKYSSVPPAAHSLASPAQSFARVPSPAPPGQAYVPGLSPVPVPRMPSPANFGAPPSQYPPQQHGYYQQPPPGNGGYGY